MQSNKVLWIGGIIVIAFIVWIVAAGSNSGPAPLDAFASCLTEKGATYYGAFWCPNCQKQNAMFGKSKKLVNYVECSTPDSKGQLQVCIDAGITNYPTWDFPPIAPATTTTRVIGVQELETLSQMTGCVLSGSGAATTTP